MRAISLFLILIPTLCDAQSCYEPSAPRCLTGITTFEDEFSFSLCRRAMDDYAQDVEDYSRCLGEWVQSTADNAQVSVDRVVDDYTSAVRYWNCKAADPDGYCGRP